jgi:hypothetical protein
MSRKTERIFVNEFNSLLPPPPIIPPLTSPFPIPLANGDTVDLAAIEACIKNECEVVLLSAVINWSATFIPPASVSTTSILNNPGYANVTFEFLRNGIVIYRVTQTAIQNGFPINQPTVLFTLAVPTYEIASMLFLDTASICCNRHPNISCYTVRANNITLVSPIVATGGAVTTAAVGAVTFVVTVKER